MICESASNKQSINWLLFLELLCCTLTIWFTCSKNHEWASRTFTLSFLVLLFYFIKYIYKTLEFMDELDVLLLAIIIISFFNVLFSIFLAGQSLSFEGLKNYIIFLCTNIFFRMALKINIDKKTADWIFTFGIIISIIYIYCKKKYPQPVLLFGFNGLSLNFSNPNLAGMFLFLTLLYTFLGIFYFKNYIIKLICVILSYSNFSMLLETEARNPVLAFILFLGIFVLSLFKSRVRFSKAFNFIVNIAPITFVFLYLTLINTIVKWGWLDFWVSAGKNLTSRVKIWSDAFQKLGFMWITGDYANMDGNAHNSHMVLLCSFGVVVLILTIILTYKISVRISEKISNRFQTSCLTAFFAAIFMGFGEGALYSGGLGLYILCGTFLTLANSNIGDK